MSFILMQAIDLIQRALQAAETASEPLGEKTGWRKKLVGFKADAAAVNPGHRSGVIA